LRIELCEPGRIHWKIGKSEQAMETKDSEWGVHFADLANEEFHNKQEIVFSFYWHKRGKWDGRYFRIWVNRTQPGETTT